MSGGSPPEGRACSPRFLYRSAMKLFTALLAAGRALGSPIPAATAAAAAAAVAAATVAGCTPSDRPVLLGGSMSGFCSDHRLCACT